MSIRIGCFFTQQFLAFGEISEQFYQLMFFALFMCDVFGFLMPTPHPLFHSTTGSIGGNSEFRVRF